MAAFQDDFSDDGNLGLGSEPAHDEKPPLITSIANQPSQETQAPSVSLEMAEASQPAAVIEEGQLPHPAIAMKSEPTSPSPGAMPPPPSTSGEMMMGSKSGSAVYIANLQWWTTDADVERFCAGYGQVSTVQFLAERSNGKSKGVALVEFTDPQAAMLCKEGLSGNDIHGKPCVVTFPSQGANRPGFGGRGGIGMGPYDRMGGRMMDGRGGRGRGRGYMGPGGWDMRPGMGMGPDMGYMPDIGMGDMGPMDMMGGMPPMDGPGMMHGMHGMHGMPHPFHVPGGGWY